MVQYAQVECHDCFGIFPGNIMRRKSVSRAIGKSVRDYDPFDESSMKRSLETATTHYARSTMLLCPGCISKRRMMAFVKAALLLLIVGSAVYLYLGRSSFRFTDNKFDAVTTEAYVGVSEVPDNIAEQIDVSIDPSTSTENDAAALDVAAPTDEITNHNQIEEEPTLVSPSETNDAVRSIVKQPVPKGNPGNWVNANDYPGNALKDEREGTVKFTLDVDERGRVAACEILESSGSDDLDEATCYNIQRRARFDPATDSNGAAIRSTFTNSVRWSIPS